MKRTMLLQAVLGILLLCSACVTPWSERRCKELLKENEELTQRVRKDMLDFYEYMAHTYYMLGYDYFNLYQNAVAAKNEQAAEAYLNISRGYKQYHTDFLEVVRAMRRELGLPEAPEGMARFATDLTTQPSVLERKMTMPSLPATPGGASKPIVRVAPAPSPEGSLAAPPTAISPLRTEAPKELEPERPPDVKKKEQPQGKKRKSPAKQQPKTQPQSDKP